MSCFRILRVDHYDPVILGKKNRIIYTVYGIIPTIFVLLFNLVGIGGLSYAHSLYISVPLIILIYVLLLKKLRSAVDNLKTIGTLEITRSCIRKKLGDTITEYGFQSIKKIKLTRHIPATRFKESKTRYYSYILELVFQDRPEEALIISDRSVDLNHKISITETIKGLKKIVRFEVLLEI